MSSRQGPGWPFSTGRRTPWSIWNACVMCCLCILRGEIKVQTGPEHIGGKPQSASNLSPLCGQRLLQHKFNCTLHAEPPDHDPFPMPCLKPWPTLFYGKRQKANNTQSLGAPWSRTPKPNVVTAVLTWTYIFGGQRGPAEADIWRDEDASTMAVPWHTLILSSRSPAAPTHL